MAIGLFDSLILILFSAVLVIVVARRLNIPLIIAYIVIGIIAGSPVLGWIPDTTATHTLAKFGVVFLMFTIGLEFSLNKMIKMRSIVFGLGAAQVVLTAGITIALGYWLGMSLIQSVVIGCIVTMSSTAIVSKQLVDQNELGSPHGQYAIAILLFQDLAVIPFFILISSFSQQDVSVHLIIWASVGKTVLAVGVILAVGFWLLRPAFKEIVLSESLELFTLSVLLVTLSAAWFTNRMGLSLALGGFIAGMMLGETEFRHQIESTIRPFRDLLLGLFFITVGMLFKVEEMAQIWPWVLLLFAALTFFKILLIGLLTYVADRKVDVAAKTGLILAQGGEFGFALLTLALSDNLLPSLYGQVVLGALLFSMAIAPILIRYNDAIVRYFLPEKWRTEQQEVQGDTSAFTKNLTNHVIICGFGRTGYNITKILMAQEIPCIALDLDYPRVMHGQEDGFSIIYGDAAEYDILRSVNIKQAKAVVVAFDKPLTAKKILQQVRSHHKKLPIYVRTADDTELETMQAAGATEVIPTSLEISMTIASHVLLELGVNTNQVTRTMNKLRMNRYEKLRPIIPSEGME